MPNYTVSLCMIVKNEEEFLERCLNSVKEIVNEIIIVDTGSTDSTLEIAKEHNAKIYNFEWNGDFSAARNFSIKNAASDYILILDADEYLDENGRVLMHDLSSCKDYYILNIKNYMDHQVMNHQAIRMFRKNTGLIYKGKIHEHLNVDDFNNLTQETANIWIHHTGYQSNLYTRRNKHERNLKLLLEEVKNNPSGYNYFNLGNQYKANSEFEKAIDAYKQAFYLSKDRVYLSFLLDQMGKCLLYLNRYEEGIELISNSFEGFPAYTNLSFTLGELYEGLGYLKNAEICYLKCLELGEVKDQQTTEGIGSYLSNFNLMRVYDKQGDLPKALEKCVLSLRQNQNHLPTLIYLIKLLLKGNIPHDEMRKFIDSCYLLNEQQHLNNLLIALFLTRSPLLLHYLDLYQLEVERVIKTVALQYGNREKEALIEWKKVESVSYELAEDIVALSFKLSNTDLLPLIRDYFNIKDYKLLTNLILKKESTSFTKTIQDFIKRVIPKAGQLSDLETVTLLLDLITNDNTREQTSLMKDLIEVGLKNLVIEYTSSFLSRKLSEDYLELLGDLYARNGLWSNALSLFIQLKGLNSKYSSYEKIFNIYRKTGDKQSMQKIEKEIKDTFPLVNGSSSFY